MRVDQPQTQRSAQLFADACAVIPGGVNSPVRAFNSVGGTPRFITSAKGYWLTDADDNRYVDLVCSWGPMLLGHAHPAVVEAVQKAAVDGLSFGAPTPSETELAAEIIDRVAPVERLRLALRLAPRLAPHLALRLADPEPEHGWNMSRDRSRIEAGTASTLRQVAVKFEITKSRTVVAAGGLTVCPAAPLLIESCFLNPAI